MDEMQVQGGREAAEKKGGRGRRFLVFFLILLAVLSVVVVVAYRDGTGLDVLRRYFNYGGSASAAETEYLYESDASSRFALLDDRLVTVSDSALQILKADGKEVYSKALQMRAPALSVGGGYAAAVDVGGSQLLVVDREGERLSLTADEAEPFISANLNGNGWLAVTERTKNYKASVSVYNDKMQKVFTFNSSRRFVMDAWVTEDGRSLAAVTLGQADSVFVSDIVLYDLDSKDPRTTYSITDGLVLSIGQVGGRLTTVADTGISFADTAGKLRGTYSYAEEYLREYDLGADNCAVLLLNRYRSGSVGRLVTVGTDGTQQAELDIRDEVLDLSAAGRYIAVLYTDRLVIYTTQLQEYATFSGIDSVKGVCMRSDGSAVLLGARKATVFVP